MTTPTPVTPSASTAPEAARQDSAVRRVREYYATAYGADLAALVRPAHDDYDL